MEKLTFKSKKQTERDLAHTDVFYDGTYIGYVIKESLPKHLCVVDVNWHFVSKTSLFWGKRGRTKKDVISKIELRFVEQAE